MNWLELDKVRSGHTTRMRRKPPDPSIGAHLPPPVAQKVSDTPITPTLSGVFSQGHPMIADPQTALISRTDEEAPGASPPPLNGWQQDKTQATVYGQYHSEGSPSGSSARASPMSIRGPVPSPGLAVPLGTYHPNSNLNVTRHGATGRLSRVIDDMRMQSSEYQGRVLSLKGAAAEASHAHGDSLDLLLQEFAGISRSSYTSREPSHGVGGRQAYASPTNAGLLINHSHQQQDRSVRGGGVRTSQGLVAGGNLMAYPSRGDRPDFAGTMVHITEVVTAPKANMREVDRYTRPLETPNHSVRQETQMGGDSQTWGHAPHNRASIPQLPPDDVLGEAGAL